ncbi:DUF3035 domain-containing protein [Albibacillus kandeliae]|uniref:DUF3035 domain-containing protein n=1 Tax=Albibacillus kandeliae TaxID=2174228 RepID=UPI000D685EFD|nr:DUF3035 domain-containing protein [Albibacillus kandeliae]
MRTKLGIMVLTLAVAVSGCAQKGLMDLRQPGDGPDEFMILPTKPLTIPGDTRSLPAPTPGGSNLVDKNPKADAIAALGGRPDTSTSVPSSDSALVTQASRYGVSGGIRQDLAQQDADYLQKQGRWTRLRLFPVDRYAQIYKRQTLDPFEESKRLRRMGVQTPSSPPEKN